MKNFETLLETIGERYRIKMLPSGEVTRDGGDFYVPARDISLPAYTYTRRDGKLIKIAYGYDHESMEFFYTEIVI
jgi:hypothetical protein